MTREELYRVLASTGIPCAYLEWGAMDPGLPRLVYEEKKSKDFAADDAAAFRMRRWCVQLYTDGRDEAAEGKVLDAFAEAGVFAGFEPAGAVPGGAHMTAFYPTTY
ncbi:hypothetical protein GMI70_02850 [Eggerthellaceae bacterium zg-893]|nr:hypothetical protein [Eggerthellaceae bacterium zg-893]